MKIMFQDKSNLGPISDGKVSKRLTSVWLTSSLPACFVDLSTGRCYVDLVMQQAAGRTMSPQSQYVYLNSSIEHVYI